MKAAEARTVVLTAFACDPGLPSEPTIGWEYLNTWLDIADDEDLRVVAVMNERSRDASTRQLEADRRDTSRLTIVSPKEHMALRVFRHHKLTRLEHIIWGLRTPSAVRRVARPEDVVLARHVTFASELLPAPITWLRNAAFTVWGPVGSTGRADAYRYHPRPKDWRKRYVVQRIRDALSTWCARRTGRLVDLTLVTSPLLAARLESDGSSAVVFPNTRPIAPRTVRQQVGIEGRDLHLLCVGNLVPLKRFELAIAALNRPLLTSARLRIVGKPAPGQPNHLLDLARSLGVADRVHFLGHIERDQVLEEMQDADVLVHLSAREGGSGVVGEATSVGLPVVVFAGTGADAVLTYAAAPGARVPIGTSDDADAVAKAVASAAREPRRASTVWTSGRLSTMERTLLADARSRPTA